MGRGRGGKFRPGQGDRTHHKRRRDTCPLGLPWEFDLPPGSSLARTDAVTREVNEILTSTPGVYSTAAFAGLDGATLTLASNEGAIFSVFKPFEERDAQGLTADVVLASINKRLAKIDGAFVITILPPPINGIGNAGGFKMMLEDKKNLGPAALEAAAQELAAAANADPRLSGVFTPFTSTTPNLYADIDRVRAAKLGVPAQRVFEALQVYLGSAYVNDFNYLGRTYQVMAQADEAYRLTADDIGRYKTIRLICLLFISGDKRDADGQCSPAPSVCRWRE